MSGNSLECVMRCLEGVRTVSDGVWYLEGALEVSKRCFEGGWKVSGRCLGQFKPAKFKTGQVK